MKEPSRDCPLCPRLVAFRHEVRGGSRAGSNAPVRSFGPLGARLLIVGLAAWPEGARTAPGAPSPATMPAICSMTRSSGTLRTRTYQARSGRRLGAGGYQDRQRRALRSAPEQAASGRDRDVPHLPHA